MTTLAWRSPGQFRQFFPPNALVIQQQQQSQSHPATDPKRKRVEEAQDTFGAGPGPSTIQNGAQGQNSSLQDDIEVMSEGSAELADEEPARKKKKAVTAKSPTVYANSTELLNALSNDLKANSDVVFAGSYLVSSVTISNKQRVQEVTNDVWRATGYRFTVKDHPRTKDGHKTRLWCSQDEMRKHKPNAKARVTASGESLAKARYPCRSRLFISSREWNSIGQSLVTVRLHHHYAHEPYNEGASRASGSVQSTWTGPAPTAQPPMNGAQSYGTPATHDHREGTSSRSSVTPFDPGVTADWDVGSDDGTGGDDSETEEQVPEEPKQPQDINVQYPPQPQQTIPSIHSVNHSHSHVHVHNNGPPTTLSPHLQNPPQLSHHPPRPISQHPQMQPQIHARQHPHSVSPPQPPSQLPQPVSQHTHLQTPTPQSHSHSHPSHSVPRQATAYQQSLVQQTQPLTRQVPAIVQQPLVQQAQPVVQPLVQVRLVQQTQPIAQPLVQQAQPTVQPSLIQQVQPVVPGPHVPVQHIQPVAQQPQALAHQAQQQSIVHPLVRQPSSSPLVPHNAVQSPLQPSQSQITAYQTRMRQHIRNIRDFCDGLEYQVQFNDFRMLDELEKEGGDLLRFVHACLQREGRLTASDAGAPPPR